MKKILINTYNIIQAHVVFLSPLLLLLAAIRTVRELIDLPILLILLFLALIIIPFYINIIKDMFKKKTDKIRVHIGVE